MKAKIRILHIDDNLHDRQLIKDALLREHFKFEVVDADSRELFEKHLAEKDFDIILSDFNILGFDGLQVLQLVKDRYPDMPVIIVTGTGSEEIAVQAMKMGASDYVIKSVSHIRGLAPTIDQVIKNRKILNEREIALEDLRESEEKYRNIFENIQDVFYQINNNGLITEISPSILRLGGYLREELMGTQVALLYFDPDEREMLRRLLMQYDGVWDYEVRFVTKSGHVKYTSLNAHVMRNKDDEQIGIEGSIRDIDERKRMETELLEAKEKAEESDRLKTAFLHNISHEIRTPMNAIVGFSGFLNDPDLSSEKRMLFADIIIQSSNQLLSVITDIISIASIEAGQEKIIEDQIDLDSTLARLFEQFMPKAEAKNLRLNLKPFLLDHDKYISTDKTKLVQVLSNLIDNALKFTSKGSVYFGYTIKNKEFEFFVEDTGIGIAHDMHDEVFKRFRQVESTSTRQFGGSGLGLSISKAYVELLGGKIWVDSALDKGSVFYFTIPIKKAGEIEPPEKKPYNEQALKVTKSKTLLIAEDEDTNFMLLKAQLSGLAFNIIRASNGLEAVEVCKSRLIDLVLMDIKMPVMNGYEAAKEIRKFLPYLPIIAQTAYSTEVDKNKAYAHGCTDFISKPFRREQLISKILDQLNKKISTNNPH